MSALGDFVFPTGERVAVLAAGTRDDGPNEGEVVSTFDGPNCVMVVVCFDDGYVQNVAAPYVERLDTTASLR